MKSGQVNPKLIIFSSLDDADIKALTEPTALPAYFTQYQPKTNSTCFTRTGTEVDPVCATNPMLIDRDNDNEAFALANWTYKKLSNNDEIQLDATRGSMNLSGMNYNDVKGNYSSPKQLFIEKVYNKQFHSNLSADSFYKKIIRCYSQSFINLYAGCVTMSLQSKPLANGDRVASVNPTLRSNNMYCDQQGNIRIRSAQSQFCANIMGKNGIHYKSIVIPGTMIFEYVLTDKGFRLDWIAFSNTLLQELCLQSSVNNLSARIAAAEKEETANAKNYVVNLFNNHTREATSSIEELNRKLDKYAQQLRLQNDSLLEQANQLELSKSLEGNNKSRSETLDSLATKIADERAELLKERERLNQEKAEIAQEKAKIAQEKLAHTNQKSSLAEEKQRLDKISTEQQKTQQQMSSEKSRLQQLENHLKSQQNQLSAMGQKLSENKSTIEGQLSDAKRTQTEANNLLQSAKNLYQ